MSDSKFEWEKLKREDLLKEKERKRKAEEYDNNPPSFEESWLRELPKIFDSYDIDKQECGSGKIVLEGAGQKIRGILDYFNIQYEETVRTGLTRRNRPFTSPIFIISGEEIARLATLMELDGKNANRTGYGVAKRIIDIVKTQPQQETQNTPDSTNTRSGRTDHPNIRVHREGGR